MDSSLVMELTFQAMRMTALFAGPVLFGLLIVGLTIGILQAATQVNESSVAFVPKLLVLAAVMMLTGPFTLAMFTDYIRELLMRIPTIIH